MNTNTWYAVEYEHRGEWFVSDGPFVIEGSARHVMADRIANNPSNWTYRLARKTLTTEVLP